MAVNPPAAPAPLGQWGPLFALKNVAIHAHLLPTGKVLYWGRRSVVGANTFESLNEHKCSTFIWDPITGDDRPTAQLPQLRGDESVNLFCSGHSFLPDGTLLVVGGHLFDSEGVDQACLYDCDADTWTALDRMNGGRWYPSALNLPDGGALAISGTFMDGRLQPPPDNPTRPRNPSIQINVNPQIWRDNVWVPTEKWTDLALYPRLHVEPKAGHVFMAGPQGQSHFLDVSTSTWSLGPVRDGQPRDYATSVMYQSGKILFTGGGQDKITQLPTDLAEIIDLYDADPKWKVTGHMNFPRRQHNATVLPDGTVLVTGGTRGVAGESHAHNFNNLSQGAPVRQAELWAPDTGIWTPMAEESVDRCYHSTALLLPNGRVLSAGGGEFADPDDPNQPNNPAESHRDAQLFSPPYLLTGGSRPTVSDPPREVTYDEEFNVVVGAEDIITKVSWIRLGSVTHSCNQNQSCIFLKSQQAGSTLTVTAPANTNIAPPGHYMLFVLNNQGVPSEAPIIRIAAPVSNGVRTQRTSARITRTVNLTKLNTKIMKDEGRPPTVVGVTPSCPYGISACWGGAFGALEELHNVKIVRPVPDAADSLAFVYLNDDALPDIDTWREQFAEVVNGTYIIRGIEITLSGLVTQQSGGPMLTGTATRREILLAPLQAANKVQWDIRTRANKPLSDLEASAFERLTAALVDRPTGITIQVTGPLVNSGEDFSLQVREFEISRRGLVRQAKRLVTGMIAWLSKISCFP